MKFNRSGGILLHPTSLPGPDGIGDLGPEAYRWVNFLENSGCTLWQVLPLGPTGYGDSPYQCFSAFAGNPYIINPLMLVEDEILEMDDLQDRPVFPEHQVEYGDVINWKVKLLDRAFARFKHQKSGPLHQEFTKFVEDQKDWLEDYALFMAIKSSYGGAPWEKWPEEFRNRDQKTLDAFTRKHDDDIESHRFRQFIFYRQWLALKKFANEKEISIIGDIPIFVAYDSADAWAHRELFYFDDEGKPTVVAGVPPDYFSKTGQLWGNPLYRWDVHKKSGYEWWLKRMKATFNFYDIVRLDHFRGFVAYWEVPAEKDTAEVGKWVPGPGADFFKTVKKELGELPIIAEDLGFITQDVIDLREQFELPGMKILQFAFGGDPEEPFLPHNYPENCVAYTGTHDNDTSLGWYKTTDLAEQDFCRRYLGRSGENISWDFIREIWSSVANTAVAPMQDFLGLGSDARMNYPGRASGNWSWRMTADQINTELQNRIKEHNFLYNRLPQSQKPEKKKSIHQGQVTHAHQNPVSEKSGRVLDFLFPVRKGDDQNPCQD